MTRGQDGSLRLSCMTLSFTTPRRFYPGALSSLLTISDAQTRSTGFLPSNHSRSPFPKLAPYSRNTSFLVHYLPSRKSSARTVSNDPSPIRAQSVEFKGSRRRSTFPLASESLVCVLPHSPRYKCLPDTT